MKPNDKAIEAAIRYLEAPMSAREQMEKILTAAYAAQFQPSEDYAGLVKELRERAGSYDIQDWHREIELKAADALEAVLAERDDSREQLKYFGELHRQEYDRICAERDRFKAEWNRMRTRLDKAYSFISRADWAQFFQEEHVDDRLSPVEPSTGPLTNGMAVTMPDGEEKRLAVAPVDDEELVEIAVQAGYKAEYEADMSVGQTEPIFVETVYKPLSIYKPIMTAAIAAIRPHIEAAERERCAKVAEGFSSNRDWVPGSLWGNIRNEIAAAIRSGK